MAITTDTKPDRIPDDNLSRAPSTPRSSLSSIDSDDKLPPPYHEVAGKENSVPAYSRDEHGNEIIRFPSRFNLYHKKLSWRKTTWILGEHYNQPLFSIVLVSGWKGTKFILHRGDITSSSLKDPSSSSDGENTVLAEIGSKRYMSIHNMISLPKHNVLEELHTKFSFQSPSYSFSAPVKKAGGEKVVQERFVWRQSHGQEVKHVSKNKYVWGWKLVRLDSETGGGSVGDAGEEADPTIVRSRNSGEGSSKGGGKRYERDLGESSDGKEVVAVWADNMKWSKNKLVKFEFLGAGRTGELGEVVEIMAVSSGMRIWQILRAGSSGGAVEAAASAAISAGTGS
ncbi:hypothetical protein CB0940_09116 [Cercospora beticola]|uniref:Uncharacterized protein n=1 Tax=Cercospora beticola TaxID=122368 RepID=A0A2G5HH91_CERBT|nr:hypothetical protein CB0940_09116 [Cercospora beticola]PIA91924.1 hypothetical protein CB0940_09116 [Cercospora beticola]WPB06600.1 hypothetical protein RHO25_011257 [Cercospora beticola]